MKNRSRALCGAVVAACALVAGGSSFDQDSKPAATPSLADLAFLTGTWRMQRGPAETEETWLPAKGGAMFGISRTTSGERTLEFEFLRLEQKKDGVYYVAQPNGGAPTRFKLTKIEGGEALFENPEHDFPTRIAYAKRADGGLTAWIDGPADRKSRRMTFAFQPAK
jgi:hypothetical protein